MTRPLLVTGSYTHSSPVGIRVYDGSQPGALVELAADDGVEHPSFLAAHPSGRLLYAVSETDAFDGAGGLVTFRVDTDRGTLEEIGRISSRGAGPCHVAVDPAGRFVYVANYTAGSIAAFSLDGDGRPERLRALHQHEGSGPTSRQDGPHAHCVQPVPAGGAVYGIDLGTDQIIRYEHRCADGESVLGAARPLTVAPGCGPRHITFSPTKPIAVVVNELANTVSAYARADEPPHLRHLDTVPTLPTAFAGDSLAAAVRFHPRGHRLYTTNRGHDSIAVFATDRTEGPLVPIDHVSSGGRTPRSMTFHPDGSTLYVTNQGSDQLNAFTVDPDSGIPEASGVSYDVPSPTCVIAVEAPT